MSLLLLFGGSVASTAQQVAAQGEQTPRYQQLSTAQTWYQPDAEHVLGTPTGGITTATVAQQIGAQGEQLPRFEQVSTARQWFAPEQEHQLGAPTGGITTATAAQQVATTEPDDTPQVWRDGRPWVTRTDDDLDSLLPVVIFDPAPFAEAWQAQPADWRDGTPWFAPDASREGFPPSPSAATFEPTYDGQQDVNRTVYWFQPDTEAWVALNLTTATVAAQADLWQEQPQAWRDGTPWFAPDDDYEAPLQPITVPVDQQAALWSEQPQAWSQGWTQAVDEPAFVALVPPYTTDQLAGLWADDHQQDRSLQPVWFAPDSFNVLGPPSQVTTATVPQQSPLWIEQPGQELPRYPVWFVPPDDMLSGVASLLVDYRGYVSFGDSALSGAGVGDTLLAGAALADVARANATTSDALSGGASIGDIGQGNASVGDAGAAPPPTGSSTAFQNDAFQGDAFQ